MPSETASAGDQRTHRCSRPLPVFTEKIQRRNAPGRCASRRLRKGLTSGRHNHPFPGCAWLRPAPPHRCDTNNILSTHSMNDRRIRYLSLTFRLFSLLLPVALKESELMRRYNSSHAVMVHGGISAKAELIVDYDSVALIYRSSHIWT
ncbi:hypothetical protein T12_3279 [Trichinella patagoniensis]|uniref:Uncharacterized protein n=1 Tax=Trichinella patagoniensis TaxID=990121 RepID=A0A0V0Z7N2_9BILA|nr:hypothetical protein T12_3279 [Trichinella patagoniensis]